jgi:hypothetical protein
MKIIAKQIKKCTQSGLPSSFACMADPVSGIRSQFHIFFIPHRSVSCEQMLEDEGVLEVVNIGEYRLGFVPLDTDILSLEMTDLYYEASD